MGAAHSRHASRLTNLVAALQLHCCNPACVLLQAADGSSLFSMTAFIITEAARGVDCKPVLYLSYSIASNRHWPWMQQTSAAGNLQQQ
jgi:hypothetical protein